LPLVPESRRSALVLFHILPSFLTSFLRACRMHGEESSITPSAVPPAELLQPAEIIHLQSDHLVQWNAKSLASPATPPAPISSTMPQTTPALPPPAFSCFSPFMVAEAVQVQPAATALPPAPTNGIQPFHSHDLIHAPCHCQQCVR
jgi:hypothetical protein